MATVKHNIILGLDARQFQSSMDKAGKAIARVQKAFAVIAGARMAMDFANLAYETQNVTNAFNRLNDAGLLAELRGATKGMVSDLELMKQAIKFDNFKLPVEQLSTYMAFAAKRAAETGENIDYMTESIVRGLGFESLRVLDNLQIDMGAFNAAVKDGASYAEALAQVMKDDIGDFAANDAQVLVTNFKNLSSELAVNSIPLLTELFGIVNAGLVQLTYWKDNIKAGFGMYDSMNPKALIELSRAQDYDYPGIRDAIDAYIAAVREGKGLADQASMDFIQSMRDALGTDFDMEIHGALVSAINELYYKTAKAREEMAKLPPTVGELLDQLQSLQDDQSVARNREELDKIAKKIDELTKKFKDTFMPVMDATNLKVRGVTGAMQDLNTTLNAATVPENMFRDTEKYLKNFDEWAADFKEIQSFLASTFQSVFTTALNAGEDFFTQMDRWIKNFIKQMLAAAATAALLSGISGGSLSFLTAFKGLLGITKMAHGGIVNGPTPIVAGEAGPEAIIPLHKLNAMGGNLSARISGRDLLLILERERTAKDRLYG